MLGFIFDLNIKYVSISEVNSIPSIYFENKWLTLYNNLYDNMFKQLNNHEKSLIRLVNSE